MRCVRCHSENIPGQERCFKCGSVLEADAVVDVHPPRMSGWRRPLRGIIRSLRGSRAVPEKLPTRKIRHGLDKLASDGLIGLVLSIVPGLAHLLKRRFREVRMLVLLWAVLLAVGLFLYGSSTGSILIGLAIGVHAWIAIQFGLFKEITGFVERIVITLVVMVCFGVLYWAVPRLVFYGYTGGYTALTIPDMEISAGDYLLVRRTGHLEETLPRGTLVLVRPARMQNNRVDRFNREPLMIGQIVGLPGETVRIANGFYAAGDEVLNPERFPVPRWLRRRRMTAAVGPRSYFVSLAYTLAGHGNILPADAAIRNVCLVKAEDIQGRAFMRWWPLARRGFIE